MDDIRFDSAGQYNMAPTYGAFQQQKGHLEQHPSVHARRRLFLGDLAKGFRSMVEAVGMKLPTTEKGFEKFSFKEAAGKMAKGVAQKLGMHMVKRQRGAQGKKVVKGAMSAGLKGAGAAEGGALGVIAGALVDQAFDAILDKVMPEDETQGDVEWGDAKGRALKHGDWVMIDNGELSTFDTVKRESRLMGPWGGMMGDMGVSDGSAEIIREVDYTPGFVIGPSTRTPGFWNVFNFGKGQAAGRAEEKSPRAVHLVGSALASKWGDTKLLETVKETYFARSAEAAYLKGGPVVDPGALVIYDNVQNQVVHAQGSRLTIENARNERRVVSAKDVRPGPSEHNVSHNYGRNPYHQAVADTYRTSGGTTANRRFRGQWIWVRARPTLGSKFHAPKDEPVDSELAVVHAVQGAQVSVFCAIDGQRRTVAIADTLDAGDVVEMFGSSRRYQAFKNAAVVGYPVNTNNLAPGRQGHVLDLLGRGMLRPAQTLHQSGHARGETMQEVQGSGSLGASQAAAQHKYAQMHDRGREFAQQTQSTPQAVAQGDKAVVHQHIITAASKPINNPVYWILGIGCLYLVASRAI